MPRPRRSRKSKRSDAVRIPARLAPASARWLKTFAAHESVEYGEIVERALRLLRRESGFEVVRRSVAEPRIAAVDESEGETPAAA
jgi:hypothetical protein